MIQSVIIKNDVAFLPDTREEALMSVRVDFSIEQVNRLHSGLGVGIARTVSLKLFKSNGYYRTPMTATEIKMSFAKAVTKHEAQQLLLGSLLSVDALDRPLRERC